MRRFNAILWFQTGITRSVQKYLSGIVRMPEFILLRKIWE